MEPIATTYSIIAGVGSNYGIMPDLFRDNLRLPDQSMDRYCFDTWIGRERFNSGTYKTQADLDREREAAESLIPKVKVEIKGSLKWTQEEALQFLEERAKAKPKPEQAQTKNKRQRKVRTIDEIYYATMAKAGRELPSPKPAEEPRFYEGKWESLSERCDREKKEHLRKQEEERQAQQYRDSIARRERQQEAREKRLEFSSSQNGLENSFVTWADPLITDVRLVRLVLGTVHKCYSREMTPEEESDYWYWKARGK